MTSCAGFVSNYRSNHGSICQIVMVLWLIPGIMSCTVQIASMKDLDQVRIGDLFVCSVEKPRQPEFLAETCYSRLEARPGNKF